MEKETLIVLHGHEQHSFNDAKKCPECKDIAEEFEEDLEKVIAETE